MGAYDADGSGTLEFDEFISFCFENQQQLKLDLVSPPKRRGLGEQLLHGAGKDTDVDTDGGWAW